MRTDALIGLGSNLGDRASHLERAVEGLRQIPGSQVVSVSSWHATSPVGGPGGQSEFLNGAALLKVEISPRGLLEQLLRIETEEGRSRSVRWAARPLDLDLLLYGLETIEEPDLIVPHPRMAVRRFVLDPAAEIAAGMIEPRTGRSVSDLLANLDRRPSVLMLDPALDASALRALEPGVRQGSRDGEWRIIQASENVELAEEPTFAVRARGVREWGLGWLDRWPMLEVDASDPGWVEEVRAAMQAARD